MIRTPLRLVAALALVALTFFVVACGGDESRATRPARQQWRHPPRARRAASSSSSAPPTSTSSTPARPTTRVATRSSTPPRSRSTRSSPATEKPSPTSPRASRRSPTTRRAVTVTLKKGVKFAPPVNREIQAKDIKYAFERAFTKNVPTSTRRTSTSSRARRRSPAKVEDISGIVRRRSLQDHVQAQPAAGAPASPRSS